MKEAGRRASTKAEVETKQETLRARYLDYCSARVTEALLRLSADEAWLLARDAAREAGATDGIETDFEAMVRLATIRLSRTLDLPTLPEFTARYEANPEQFEADLMGFSESDLAK